MISAGAALTAAVLLGSTLQAQTAGAPDSGSVYLEQISWVEAERALTPDAVVVITTGAASKEHGLHLPLSADFIQAEYVKDRVAERTRVVVAPSIPYGYYPPFTEYPGSTTLRLSVMRDMVADVCRSLARSSSARRFYILSHGNISRPVMQQVRSQLEAEGLLVRFTEWEAAKRPVAEAVRQQRVGSHADEIETSMLLHVAPEQVQMSRAVREYGRSDSAGVRMIGNRPARIGDFSPSGVFGDPTLATPEKGRQLVEAVIEAALRGIEELRRAPLPPAVPLEAYFAGLSGVYEVAAGDTMRVSREGDLLAVERTGRPKALLQTAGRYRFGLWATEVRFLTGPDEAVTHLLLSESGSDVLARRIQ